MKAKYISRINVMGAMILLMIMGISGCNKELTQMPNDQFASGDFWTSETNAKIALVGVYRGGVSYGQSPNPSDWWTHTGTTLMELSSDNAYDRRGDNSAFNTLTNGNLLTNNDYIRLLWSSSYKRIAICNYFLENIGKVTMDQSKIDRMSAEARFIRATQYFYLSQFWGSVPLVVKSLTPEEANIVTKTSKSDIVKFTIDELKASATSLPRYKDLTNGEKGQACKQAALAFLGRLYLSEKMFTEASATYKEIIDYNDNIIDPNYTTIFNTVNEKSKENIFSFQHIEGVFGNGLPLRTYPASCGGYNFVNIYSSLADDYDWNDGTPFSYTDPRFNSRDMGANRDPRFRFTIIWDGSVFSGKTINFHPDNTSSMDRTTYTLQASRSGYGLRKFFNESYTGDLNSYGGDIPIIRYAEVLLSYLEAELEAGHPITQSLLDLTINKVRGRQSVNMPPISQTNAALLRPILRKERRVEFAMEGIRMWDLLRWGVAGDKLQGDFWGAPFTDSKTYATASKKIDPMGYKRWYVTSKAFRKGQDEVWPIPQTEQDINPNLR
jgi:hypothetical protein